MTLPSWQDLAAGRRWHLFFAWLLVANSAAYVAFRVATGRLGRDLFATRAEFSPPGWHTTRRGTRRHPDQAP